MRYITLFILLIIITSCSYNKKTFLCGDRPCINKAEKEAYFKKNMIIEIKKSSHKDKKNISEIDKILDQAQIKNKKVKKYNNELAKEEKFNEKELKRKEKELDKQIRTEQKRKKKEEKKLIKLAKKNKKRGKKIIETENLNKNIKDFEKIVENIYSKNQKKKYPDINNIPE